jgi:hypothetical protein
MHPPPRAFQQGDVYSLGALFLCLDAALRTEDADHSAAFLSQGPHALLHPPASTPGFGMHFAMHMRAQAKAYAALDYAPWLFIGQGGTWTTDYDSLLSHLLSVMTNPVADQRSTAEQAVQHPLFSFPCTYHKLEEYLVCVARLREPNKQVYAQEEAVRAANIRSVLVHGGLLEGHPDCEGWEDCGKVRPWAWAIQQCARVMRT